ncbi:acyl-CoA thioesterase [Allosphingosinicella sp.]|uniref:acyl-CoA thioesterase n=1 Tax=Allosphingosinicella sp. TaxID=2823234 RepID=UPI002FC1654F
MTREALKGREHYKAWREIGTRWADNDAYGHVNNTVYYQWFDTAVNGWLIEAGLLDPRRGDPIGLVVETGCRYAVALSYPQAVDIGLAVEHVGNSSVIYQLGVFAGNAPKAAAEGRFVHIYVDRESRRPTRLSERWRDALRTLRV